MVLIETEDGDLINLARFDGVRKNQTVLNGPFYLEAFRLIDGDKDADGFAKEEIVKLGFVPHPQGVSQGVKEDLAFDFMDDLRIALQEAGAKVVALPYPQEAE